MRTIMKHTFAAVVASMLLAGTAGAEGTEKHPMDTKAGTSNEAAGQAMDMTKMGPWTRKPTNEKEIKKEITTFLNQEDELMKKGDFDSMVARGDFPVFMITDDAKGMIQ